MSVRREIEIEASPDEVWDALATEEGREAWLDEPDREIRVESADAPHRLVWWWWDGDSAATRVEFLVVPAVSGTRVVVTESSPHVPLASLSARFAMVAA
jgi:uncharacterized protein YndB with AHSA1/START domain